jgi:hypothetical protein
MTSAGGAGRRPRSSRASARLRRLTEEALVDAYGEDEQHGAFLVMFEEHVTCPFTALVVGDAVGQRRGLGCPTKRSSSPTRRRRPGFYAPSGPSGTRGCLPGRLNHRRQSSGAAARAGPAPPSRRLGSMMQTAISEVDACRRSSRLPADHGCLGHRRRLADWPHSVTLCVLARRDLGPCADRSH